ncbi:hypothetical protein, partial [Arcanobacterium phocae]|uniref:hypothetical protein n=1 Tax=Arcanobacterium phocae TaxID=131112 RepID=UPI001C0EC44A
SVQDCESKKVTETRQVTTTPYKWDSAKKVWVLDTANEKVTDKVTTRDMTDAELQKCSPAPKDKVVEEVHLASTGLNASSLLLSTFVLLGLGISFMTVRKRLR